MAQQFPLTVNETLHPKPVKAQKLMTSVLVAMRPQQWLKNLFVLAPLLFSMKLIDPQATFRAVVAAISFCLLSSALYLLNDILDAETDRAHPEKRLRPIASGALSISKAMLTSVLLSVGAFSMAFGLGSKFGLLAVAYCVVTLSYCLVFKQTVVLDAMLIAAGFVLRVVSGAVAINVVATHWLIMCAFLLALFLAFSKRRQELLMLSNEVAQQHRRVLGQYSVAYLDRANNILLGATIVCYALYTVAPETIQRFGTDKLIYGSAFVIYGLLRYMALLQDTGNGGNPSGMLVKDKPLLLAVIGWAVYNALVIYRSFLSL